MNNRFAIATILIAALILITITALVSRSNPKFIKLDKPLSEFSDSEIKELKELSGEEKKLLAQFELRKAFNSSLSADTVGDAIKAQKEFKAEAQLRATKREMERAEIQRKKDKFDAELKKKLKVLVINKGFEKIDYSTYTYFKVRLENRYGKDIRAMSFTLSVSDLFGDHIQKLNFKLVEPIEDQTYYENKHYFKYNQFIDTDKRLRALKINDMRYKITYDAIIFKDGTTLNP